MFVLVAALLAFISALDDQASSGPKDALSLTPEDTQGSMSDAETNQFALSGRLQHPERIKLLRLHNKFVLIDQKYYKCLGIQITY